MDHKHNELHTEKSTHCTLIQIEAHHRVRKGESHRLSIIPTTNNEQRTLGDGAINPGTPRRSKSQAGLASLDTVFAELQKSKIPPHELPQQRLQNEAASVIGAAFGTTRWALTVSSDHILANPAIYKRLRKGLFDAIPIAKEIPPWATLQNLPYLSVCIDEALYVGYGIVHSSPRSSPDPFTYKSHTIPPGYHVSSSAFHKHHHDEIFPQSYAYKPESWLDNSKGPDGVKSLSRYTVAFGRGSMICLGVPVAYEEIYITLATLMRRSGSAY